ncbi:Uncharacterised protein [Pseudomonas fluorescens]|mgnify:CR=1 FL=1|uniref:Uncharacterized protein n=1 Tax=Pseudomonas fluorescens TaxID=294 RepID=A0A379IFE4_PSEFL|nr:hypothetical protein [Pseudomonas fluorescens]SUD31577.1 Uncharacterised protein [Pseudomonas fluorescens]
MSVSRPCAYLPVETYRSIVPNTTRLRGQIILGEQPEWVPHWNGSIAESLHG